MEDEKLFDFFKGIIVKVEEAGYPPIVVRESFDKVAPRLVWQHNWLILFILIAGILGGIFLPFFVVFGSLFITEWSLYIFASIPFLGAGCLFYFALSAFNIHEWVKFLFTFIMSLLIAAAGVFSHFIASNVLTNVNTAFSTFTAIPDAIPAESGVASLSGIISSSVISLTWLIIIIIVAYNIWPLFFWIKEKYESKG